MDLLVYFVAVAHLVYTPFTKVEESFNIQAIHDILYHRLNITLYDHNDYPGVVPRSFLGPLFISAAASPIVTIFELFDVRKFWTQYIVRLILTVYVVFAWTKLRDTIKQMLGFEVSIWYTMITITQFHFMFYMSRPLPNIIAMPLVLLAVNYWLQRKVHLFIILSGAAIIIFRAELAALLGLFLVYDLYYKRINLIDLIKIVAPAGIVLLALTIAIDSFFWNRLLWPEGEVLWFNTILNRSVDYGTSPVLWYFYSAIPRALGASLPLIPVGLYFESRIRAIVVPALMFIALYSLMPHKELRFIIYAFPLLNIAVACACHRMWINRTKSIFNAFLAILAGGHLVVNTFLTLFLLLIAGTNYPGGVAMSRLHRIAAQDTNVSIHICNLAAQSGVSRFTEMNLNWTYSKKEHLKPGDPELHSFSYLLFEAKNKYAEDMVWLQKTHESIEQINCFNSIGLQTQSMLPVKIKTKPCIGIWKQKQGIAKGRQILDKKKLNGNLNERQSIISAATVSLNETSNISEEDDDQEIDHVDSVVEITINDNDRVVEITNEIAEVIKKGNDNDIPLDELSHILNNDNSDNNNNSSNEQQIPAKPLIQSVKSKLKELIESHYRAKGSLIESDKEGISQSTPIVDNNNQPLPSLPSPKTLVGSSTKSTIKRIIKAEQIKELVEKIGKLDLTKLCDLERLSTKDCLKQIIDDYDEKGQ